MSNGAEHGPIVYQTEYETDAGLTDPFDTWLRDHVADMLQCPGFESAEILAADDAGTGRVRRTVQYRLRDSAAWNEFRAGHAQRLEDGHENAFGGRAELSRRVLARRDEFQRDAISTDNCLNCGEVLLGQHCAHCGQRARVRVLSLWGLLREVLGDLLDLDSRLWRTLWPLVLRPGLLTSEYLRGRRTWYTPPFRLYLALSIVFFVVTSLDGGVHISLNEYGNISLEAGQLAPQPGETAGPTPELDPDQRALVDAIIARVPEAERVRVLPGLEQQIARVKPEDRDELRRAIDDPCGQQTLRVKLDGRMKQYEPRLRDACRRIVADSQGFGSAVYANVPRMMFVFLPLIAALMHLLFLGSGRFYVEHLLFFVHFHAFFFLFGTIVLILERASLWLSETPAGPMFSAAEDIGSAAFILYTPFYLYLAMRRVYTEGLLLTFAKFVLLLIGYTAGLFLTFLGLLAYTALSI